MLFKSNNNTTEQSASENVKYLDRFFHFNSFNCENSYRDDMNSFQFAGRSSQDRGFSSHSCISSSLREEN